MIADQYQVISTNSYKNYILKDLNITNDICRKCRDKLGIIQRITDTYRALAPGDCTCRHKVAIIVHQDLAVKFGLSNGPPMPYYISHSWC